MISDEDTKVMSNMSGSHDFGEFDLSQNYQNSIECLVQCESIISTLQKQLASKDEQISSLEEKIVQMSLELASSKAFEDEHRCKRRISNVDHYDDSSDDDESCSPSSYADKKHHQPMARRAKSMDLRVSDTTTSASQNRRKSHACDSSWSLGSMGWDGEEYPMLDDSTKASVTSASSSYYTARTTIDDSSVSRLSSMSINFGQFFRKKRSSQRESPKEDCVTQNAKWGEIVDEQRRRRHHPPNCKRMELTELQGSSSRSFLESVVFPVSFDDVLTKGL